jgi:hypothetical protein
LREVLAAAYPRAANVEEMSPAMRTAALSSGKRPEAANAPVTTATNEAHASEVFHPGFIGSSS